jgi:hypothetical protein
MHGRLAAVATRLPRLPYSHISSGLIGVAEGNQLCCFDKIQKNSFVEEGSTATRACDGKALANWQRHLGGNVQLKGQNIFRIIFY